MDFPIITLILIVLIVVGTVAAAGGLRALMPPRVPAPGAGEDSLWRTHTEASAGWPGSGRPRAADRRVPESRDDPGDNFFSDEDDFVFREPDANRGAFSQREEDRDSLDDPDRNR